MYSARDLLEKNILGQIALTLEDLLIVSSVKGKDKANKQAEDC